jgi:hypothetical protein
MSIATHPGRDSGTDRPHLYDLTAFAHQRTLLRGWLGSEFGTVDVISSSLFLGSLLRTLKFVDLSLQTFQLSAFGRLLLGFALLGLPLLCRQPVRFDALLTAALAL